MEELGREGGGLPAAGVVDHPLTAGEIGLKAAAEELHLLAVGLPDLLLDQPESLLVVSGAVLVLLSDPPHAGSMCEVVGLVGTGSTQVLYHLDNSTVEQVEVIPLLSVQTPHGEGVDAGQAVHQLGADGKELLAAGAPAQVPVVRELSQGVGTAGHQAGGAVTHSKHCSNKEQS